MITITELTNIFESYKDPQKGIKMSKYMKYVQPFLGIQTKQRRLLSKDFISSFKEKSVLDVMKSAELLISLNYREYLYVAQDLILKYYKLLSIKDVKYVISKFITHCPNWDNCDGFIMSIYRWTILNPKYLKSLTNFTLRYKNLWIRRAGILLQLHHKNVDFDILDSVISSNISNKDFFIQKAFGWVLREMIKSGQIFEVKKIIAKYEHSFTSVAIKEIYRYYPSKV